MLIIPVENKPDWRHPPLVTLLLIVVNVWVYFALAGPGAEVSWIRYGLVPAEAAWWSYLTSMFLHGGVDHLLGNMAFLFLFGFALERVLGNFEYAALYLLGGLAGGAVHVLVNADSHVPTIGASGAVSALMGGYLAVYRLRRIRFFCSVLVYFGEFRAPALVILPLWLAKELYGFFYGGGNIAYWDHIGGLVGGAALGHLATVGGRIDTGFLEAGERQVASRATLEKLDTLFDQFKYDQARAIAAAHLVAHPADAAVWHKYLELLETDTGNPEYHRAVKRVLSLAGTAEGRAAGELIDATYRRYVSGEHPKPALNDARLLCVLGREFAEHRRLDAARRIANSLLEANRREPELAGLLDSLSRALADAGSGAMARHYRSELSVRFPDAR